MWLVIFWNKFLYSLHNFVSQISYYCFKICSNKFETRKNIVYSSDATAKNNIRKYAYEVENCNNKKLTTLIYPVIWYSEGSTGELSQNKALAFSSVNYSCHNNFSDTLNTNPGCRANTYVTCFQWICCWPRNLDLCFKCMRNYYGSYRSSLSIYFLWSQWSTSSVHAICFYIMLLVLLNNNLHVFVLLSNYFYTRRQMEEYFCC